MSKISSAILREELPKDVSLEMEVLGYCLSAKSPMVKLFETDIGPGDFSMPLHSKMFESLRSQFMRSERADTVSLAKTLAKDIDWQQCGGKEYFSALRDRYQSEGKAIQAAKHLKDLSQRRVIITGITDTLFKALDTSCDIKDALAPTYNALADSVSHVQAKKVVSIKDVLMDSYGEIESLMCGSRKPQGISTGLPSLDRATSGFAPSEYTILAGRPGTGKTALSLNFAVQAARLGFPVMYFSLEMPRDQLIKRILSTCMNIDSGKFRGYGAFSQEDKNSFFSKDLDLLAALPIHFYDFSRIHANEFRTTCHIAKAQRGAKLVIVDYIGLMKPDRFTGKRYLDVAEISATIRETAKDLKLPILALAQMNRNIEGRTSEPQLSDLRESGDLEQDADAVMFLYETPGKDDDTPTDELKPITLKLAKNRHGPEAKIPMMFERRYLRFKEIQPDFRNRSTREYDEHWTERQ